MKSTKLISPRGLFIGSFLIWFVLFLISPIKYTYTPSIKSILFLFICFIMFIGGSFFSEVFFRRRQPAIANTKERLINLNKEKILFIISVIGLLGVVLRVIELIVFEQFFAYSSIADFRLYKVSAGGDSSLVGVISSFFYPFTVVSLIIFISFSNWSRLIKVIVITNTSLYIIYNLLLGGRTSFSLLIIMIVITFLFKGGTLKYILKPRKMILYFFSITIFFFYSYIIMFNRLKEMGFSFQTHLVYTQNGRGFIIRDVFQELDISNTILGGLFYTFISFYHYLLHGYYEFFKLFDSFKIQNISFGAYEFYPIFKFFGFLGYDVKPYEFYSSNLEAVGVYSTFFGPLYTDFGYFSFVVMFLLGVICQLFYKKAKRGDLTSIILYSYLGAVLLHSSFINMIQSAMGLYILISIILSNTIIKFILRISK